MSRLENCGATQLLVHTCYFSLVGLISNQSFFVISSTVSATKILFSLRFIPMSLDMDAALVVDLEVSELSGAKMRQLQEPRWPRPRNPLSRRCLKSRPCPICPQISGQLCQDRRDPQTPEGAPWACRPVHIKLPNLLLWLPPWTQGDQNNTFLGFNLLQISTMIQKGTFQIHAFMFLHFMKSSTFNAIQLNKSSCGKHCLAIYKSCWNLGLFCCL